MLKNLKLIEKCENNENNKINSMSHSIGDRTHSYSFLLQQTKDRHTVRLLITVMFCSVIMKYVYVQML